MIHLWMRKVYNLLKSAFILMLLVSGVYPMSLSAQSESVLLRVRYAGKWWSYRESKAKSEDVFLLEVGTKGRSNFYSEARQMRDAVIREMADKGGTVNEMSQALARLPRSQTMHKFYINYPRKGLLRHELFLHRNVYYEEEYEVPQWELLSDTMSIAGYHCQAAVTKYRGREWKVFYAPDIAVNAGPWKLSGLPGLILSAADSTGDFSFECIGIHYLTPDEQPQVLPLPSAKRYIKCTRDEFRNMLIFSYKDPIGFKRSVGDPTGMWDVDGKPMIPPSRTVVLTELQ